MTYLIVEQKQSPPENLSELLKELSSRFKLDIYQCRQRLTGRGLSLLAKGKSEALEKITSVLQRYSYHHWVVEPSKPTLTPARIFGLTTTENQLEFQCRDKTVSFAKGATVLAVFADISGSLADKSDQQLLSSHAYRGRDDIRHLEEAKVHKTILQGRPILDLYLLDDNFAIEDAVRILPGKFDPKGMGDRATLSSRQNLMQVLEIAREYASDFHLHTDFGLVNLPGCQLRRDNPDDPETRKHNMISLVRYGWLMADLDRVRKNDDTSDQNAAGGELAGAIGATIATLNPALQGAEILGQVDQVGREIAEEIDAADTPPERKRSATSMTPDPGLPAPPPARKVSPWNNPRFWFGTTGSVVAVAVMILVDVGGDRLIHWIASPAFATGAIPLIIAGLLFWNAFHFLRMKRRIENTPTSRIRSVAMGMVEIKGRALRKYALVSPMSHTPCVFYRLTKYRREKNNQWKVSSISSSDNVPFMIEDETGRVEIDPAGCRVSAGTKQEGQPGQVGFLHFDSDSDDKWVEEVVVDGTLLYVLGFAAVKKEQGPNRQQQKLEALRELKRDAEKMKQFDIDGDGKISESEWDAARTAVEKELQLKTLAQSNERKKQEEHIVIGKKKGHPLIITETHSEDHLTARYLYYSIPLFIAAAVATAAAIYLFINYLGPS